jgi:transcriptional regulator with XRE-family HTH domain
MDDLEKYTAERDRREPGFARLVVDAEKRQAFARQLAEKRRSAGKSQTQVAALMETSASIVSRLEAGSDVRVSTLEKYVAAIGMQLDFRAVPRVQRASRPKPSASAARRATKAAPPRAKAKRSKKTG